MSKIQKTINSIFKSLFGGYSHRGVVMMGGNSVTWNTLQNPLALVSAFKQVPECYAPIKWQCSQVSKVRAKAVRVKGNGDKEDLPLEHPVSRLIRQPNNLNGWKNEIARILGYYQILGDVYINMMQPEGVKDVTKMYVLPSQYMGIKTNKDSRDLEFRDAEILKYVLSRTQSLRQFEFEPENIIHLKDLNFSFENNDYLFGMSSLLSLEKPITSILNAYSAKVSLYQNGPRFVMTSAAEASKGQQLLDSDGVSEIQKSFQKYGQLEGQYPVMITEHPMNVTPLNFSIANLRINENNKADFEQICNTQEISSLIFSNSEGSTYVNKKQAIEDAWEGPLTAKVLMIYEALSSKISQLYGEDLMIMPLLSEVDELKEAKRKRREGLLKELEVGGLSINEFRQELGRDKIYEPFADKYRTKGTWNTLKDNEDVTE